MHSTAMPPSNTATLIMTVGCVQLIGNTNTAQSLINSAFIADISEPELA